LILAELPIGEPVPYCEGSLGEGVDLHAVLIPNPICTFYMRASGNGMRQHGISDGDLMVIDRSVEPCSGDVVVVAHQGTFQLRPLRRQGQQWFPEPVRPGDAAIRLGMDDFDRSRLFGVVVHALHHLNKPRLRKIEYKRTKTGSSGYSCPRLISSHVSPLAPNSSN
jgi:DNA polymerase V